MLAKFASKGTSKKAATKSPKTRTEAEYQELRTATLALAKCAMRYASRSSCSTAPATANKDK